MTLSVFLSHSVKDTRIIREIKQEFGDKDVDLYIAEDNPDPGVVLRDKIKKAIESCDIFLLLVTKEGSRSRWVNSEIGIAVGARKRIVPMVQEGAKIPSTILDLERINFKIDDTDGAIKSLHRFLLKFKSKKDNLDLSKLFDWIEVSLLLVLIIVLFASLFSKK